MKTDHIMIDIETLGTSVDSAIIAIGAIRFNTYPDQYREVDKFYTAVSLDSNLKAGRVVDQSTLRWWIDTNADMLRTMLSSDKDLGYSLRELIWFLSKSPYETVWTSGTDFDIAILKHAYRQCLGTKPPWEYNAVRDCRTVYKLYGHLVDRCDNGAAHNALDDCRNQAAYLDSVLRVVGKRINNHEVSPEQKDYAFACNRCGNYTILTSAEKINYTNTKCGTCGGTATRALEDAEKSCYTCAHMNNDCNSLYSDDSYCDDYKEQK